VKWRGARDGTQTVRFVYVYFSWGKERLVFLSLVRSSLVRQLSNVLSRFGLIECWGRDCYFRPGQTTIMLRHVRDCCMPDHDQWTKQSVHSFLPFVNEHFYIGVRAE